MAKWKKALLCLAVVVGAVGIGLSVAMVIRAFQFREWGRVVLYLVTAIVCLEMLILAVGKLQKKDDT